MTSNSSCRALTWYGGAPLTLNDTLTDNMYGGFNIQAFSDGAVPAGASATYWPISGLGNPLLNSWSSSSCVGGCQLHIDHVQFTTNGNAQVGVESGGAYSTFKSLYTSSNGTSVGLDLHGSFVNTIHSMNAGGFPVYAFTTINSGQTPNGMPIMGPLIPNLEMDNNGGSIILDGLNSGSGKGIELYSLNLGYSEYVSEFDNLGPIQAPFTPAVWTYGNVTTQGIGIKNITQDSISSPCFSNFGSAVVNVTIDFCLVSGGPAIGGDPNRALNLLREPPSQILGQNQQVTQQNVNGTVSAGPYGATQLQSETQWNKPFAFPSALNIPLFWNTLRVTGVTAAVSGVGTWPSDTYSICVYSVGWNGGDSDTGGTSCAPVTVNGSQGIQISWTNVPSAMGYDIYWISVSQGSQRQNATMIPAGTTTETYAAKGLNGATLPGYPGSGLPLIDQNQVATPLLRLPNSGFKDDVAAGTLTANRTTTLPDGNSYTTVVASLTTTAATSDNVTVTGMTSSGHCSLTPTNASADTLLTGTYISAKTTNQITVTHAATSGATFDVLCTPN